MSHVASVECQVKDLGALQAAADRLGFDFIAGKTSYRWFGRFLNDWPSHRAAINKGVDPKTFGTCDHVLRLRSQPNGYEIGVIEGEDDTYQLTYDTFGNGHHLERAGGVDLVTLRNEVAAETATRVLQRRGFRVQRTDEQQHIRLVATQ